MIFDPAVAMIFDPVIAMIFDPAVAVIFDPVVAMIFDLAVAVIFDPVVAMILDFAVVVIFDPSSPRSSTLLATTNSTVPSSKAFDLHVKILRPLWSRKLRPTHFNLSEPMLRRLHLTGVTLGENTKAKYSSTMS
jgi:hypothetical protein